MTTQTTNKHPPGGRGKENWERNEALWLYHLKHPDYSHERLGKIFGGLKRQVVARIMKRWAARNEQREVSDG